MSHSLKVKPNLTPIQSKALKELCSDQTLVIKRLRYCGRRHRTIRLNRKTPSQSDPLLADVEVQQKTSQLVDLHLKPHVPKIKSYLRDSGPLISLLESTPIPENYTLATIDVKSLYLNIPHEDGINAVLNRLWYADQTAIPPPPGTMEVCRQNVPPSTRNGHGNKNGPLLCQHIHG